MQNFRNLKVWEKSHELVLDIYKITETFPSKEKFRLTSQMIRSTSSIATNIAEGCGKDSIKDYLRYIQIAIGSSNELEYQLLLSKDLHYLSENEYIVLNTKNINARRMLWSLKKGLLSRTSDHVPRT